MKKREIINISELSQILSDELKHLSSASHNDKNIGLKIEKARQIFNGSGKLISLAYYDLEIKRLNKQGVKKLSN